MFIKETRQYDVTWCDVDVPYRGVNRSLVQSVPIIGTVVGTRRRHWFRVLDARINVSTETGTIERAKGITTTDQRITLTTIITWDPHLYANTCYCTPSSAHGIFFRRGVSLRKIYNWGRFCATLYKHEVQC